MTKKDQIRALLKSIETGDPGPIAVVNEAKYIQHNPQTHEGSEGNYAGVHTDFYDLFRLAKGKVVEHWDTTEKVAPQSEWKNDNGKF